MRNVFLSILFCILISVEASMAGVVRTKQKEAARPDYFFLPIGASPRSSVEESDYLKLIQYFQIKYLKPVMEKTGKPLIIPNEWESPYFAGFAHEKFTHFQVSIWGGTVRAPGAHRGIVAAILCHEVGHILGGEPLQTIPGAEWSSSEGQSDYFAAKVCLPEFFQNHPDLMDVGEVALEIKKLCLGEVACEQIAQVGFDLVRFFQRYSYREYIPVLIDRPEKPAQTLLRNTYPSDQCRLDTYLAGARWQVDRSGERPSCWYKSE